MSPTFLTDLHGPTGATGPQGLPGVNAVANDAATAGYIATPATATKVALDAAYGTRGDAFRTVAKRASRPQEKVLATFASGHGWTATGTWTSTNVNDTTDTGWANQVIKGVTNAAAGVGTFDSGALAVGVNPTGKTFVALIKVSDPTKLASLLFYFGTSSSFTNHNAYIVKGSTRGLPINANEWTLVTFSQFTTAGTGAGVAPTYMRLRVVDAGTGAITVSFGGISYFTQTDNTGGVVSFTFDDGYDVGWTIARAALGKYRFRGTYFPIIDRLGLAGFLTVDQLKQLARDGHEIGAHATSSASHATTLPGMTADQKEAELQAMKEFGIDNGFLSESYAYPGSAIDQLSTDAAGRYFRASRTTIGQYETVPAANPNAVRSPALVNTTTLAAAKALVDSAVTAGSHVIFTIHQIVTTPATTYEWATADFTALVDYVATLNIPVLPMGEVVR